MRWSGQEISNEAGDPAALPGLDQLHHLVRSVRTPEFAGITFHEVLAKSALNRVPKAAALPFNWTVNPYRGCSHGCVYCFARHTHTYLDLDAGRDFDAAAFRLGAFAVGFRDTIDGPRDMETKRRSSLKHSTGEEQRLAPRDLVLYT